MYYSQVKEVAWVSMLNSESSKLRLNNNVLEVRKSYSSPQIKVTLKLTFNQEKKKRQVRVLFFISVDYTTHW